MTTESLRFDCPECGKSLKAPTDAGGRKTKCPKCGTKITIPPYVTEPTLPATSTPVASDIEVERQPASAATEAANAVEKKPYIPIVCNHCSQSYAYESGAIGQTIKCSVCHKDFVVAHLDVDGLTRGHFTLSGKKYEFPSFTGDEHHYKEVLRVLGLMQSYRLGLIRAGYLQEALTRALLDWKQPWPTDIGPTGLAAPARVGVRHQYTGTLFRLDGCDLTGVFVAFAGNRFSGASFKGAALRNSTWMFMDALQTDFSGADLREATFYIFECDGASFAGANLSRAKISISTTSNSWADDFRPTGLPVDFSGADLRDADIQFISYAPEYPPIFKRARMKGCKVPRELLPLLDETQKAEVIAPPPSSCFIATAAYGTDQAPAVKTLRAFRDTVLRGSLIGSIFIRTYECLSPPVARIIRHSRFLKSITRFLVVAPCSFAARLCMERHSSKARGGVRGRKE